MRLAVFFLSTALAQKYAPVERKDWVATWSDWITRQTVTAEGKVMKFLDPGPRARREIVERKVFDEQVAAGLRRMIPTKTPKTPSLLTAQPVKLRSLDVLQFSVDDINVRSIELEGEAALAFWALRVGNNSILYVQGRKSGHSSLRITTASGTRILSIDVP
jgi:hypothetical protein